VGSFLKAKRNNEPLKVYGDGSQERDFVHIDDVVKCNILSAFSKNKEVLGSIIDVGTGKSTSILELAGMIDDNMDFLPSRGEETRISRADTSCLEEILNFTPRNKIKSWVTNRNEPETIR
jgi:UDP-glucose 4-epimerase